MGKEKAGEELHRGLTLRSLIIMLILLAVFLPISEICLFYNDKPATYFGYPLSLFWTVMLFYALAKILKISAAECAVLLIVANFLAGSRITLYTYVHTEMILRLIDMTFGIFPLGLRNNPEIWDPLVPEWIIPKEGREQIVSMILDGIRPGQVFPWSAIIPPIIFFSVFHILLMLIAFAIVFGILGPTWVDKEKILFVNALPATLLIQSTITEKAGEKPMLFNLRERTMKIFWVFFTIGFIASITPLLIELFPALPLMSAFQFGWINVPVFSFMPNILPGAMGYGWWNWVQYFLGLLVPNDILATAVILYIVFGIGYNAIALQAKWYATYTPGSELTSAGALPWGQAPIAWRVMAYGAMIGAALLMFWSARDRLKLLVSSLRGNDIIELGLSMRFVTIVGIISFIVVWILMAAAGMPVIIALLWLIPLFLYHTTCARAQAQYVDHPGAYYVFDWKFLYPMGAALGYWPASPPSNQTWLLTRAITLGYSSWIPRCGGWFNITGVMPLYRIARDLKVNLKDMFIALIIVAVIGTPLVYFTGYWFVIHGGGFLNTRLYAWPWSTVQSQGLTTASLTAGATWSMEIGWLIGGMILTFVVYTMKIFLPWLPLDPYWVGIMLINTEWYWLMALASLATRLIAIRIIGIEGYYKYAAPVAIGALVGYGSVYTLSALANFGLVALPTFLRLYTP